MNGIILIDKAKDFRELFDRHYRELCLYATHFTSDIDAAEDIVPMIEQVLDVKVAVDE